MIETHTVTKISTIVGSTHSITLYQPCILIFLPVMTIDLTTSVAAYVEFVIAFTNANRIAITTHGDGITHATIVASNKDLTFLFPLVILQSVHIGCAVARIVIVVSIRTDDKGISCGRQGQADSKAIARLVRRSPDIATELFPFIVLVLVRLDNSSCDVITETTSDDDIPIFTELNHVSKIRSCAGTLNGTIFAHGFPKGAFELFHNHASGSTICCIGTNRNAQSITRQGD
mmetsp:Transcript_23984/g.35472  ORF Transcript_23984/g.35472 Transcript_23984/m.35472 type:complete len:231 (+) Transcript_23984:823-1515(+)